MRFLFLFLFSASVFSQDYVPAKSEPTLVPHCSSDGQFVGELAGSECVQSLPQPILSGDTFTKSQDGASPTQTYFSPWPQDDYRYYETWALSYLSCHINQTTGGETCRGGEVSARIKYTSQDTYVCPPSGAPDYTVGPSELDGQLVCYRPLLVDCGSGYLPYKVGTPPQCVPIQCSTAGTMKDVFVNGSMIGDNGGIYCDGQCAYSIEPANQSTWTGAPAGNSFLSGVSLGGVCGQGPGDNWGLPDATHDSCTFSTNDAGSQSISCDSAVTDPDPEGGEAETTPDDLVPDSPDTEKPLQECAEGDLGCGITNVVDAIGNAQIKNQNALSDSHNKTIQHHTKMTEIIRSNILTLHSATNNTTSILGAKLDQINDTLATGLNVENGGIGSGGLDNEEIENAVGGADDGSGLGTGYDDAMSDYLGILDGVKDSQLPADPVGLGSAWTITGGTCVGYSYNSSIGGKPVPLVFDSHCEPYYDTFMPAIQWLFYSLTALYIFHIVNRALTTV